MDDKTVTTILNEGVELISDFFEDIKEQICDDYCKWPHEAESDTALNAICEECPLQKL